MMTERERLKKLIADAIAYAQDRMRDEGVDFAYTDVADHLLSNGVTVPPCKVGDKLFRILNKPYSLGSYVSSFTETVEPYSIVTKNIMGGYSCTPFEDFGKTVFLTKEEAEAKLKERSEGE